MTSTVCGTIVPMTKYSGKFNVRLPVGLHQALVEHAEQGGVSLNTAVVALVAGGLGYATPGKPVRLTQTEARMLAFASGGYSESIDDYSGISKAQEHALDRAIGKVRSAS